MRCSGGEESEPHMQLVRERSVGKREEFVDRDTGKECAAEGDEVVVDVNCIGQQWGVGVGEDESN